MSNKLKYIKDMNVIEFLNSTAAETTGGLITATIIALATKIKKAFKGKSITQEALNELMDSNAEIKEIVMKLQDELNQPTVKNYFETINNYGTMNFN